MTHARRPDGWWHNATTEQRLAQLDGGIECGLTARQIALASEAPPNTVMRFCSSHNRSLVGPPGRALAGAHRFTKMAAARRAFFRGEAFGAGDQDEFRLDDVEAIQNLAGA